MLHLSIYRQSQYSRLMLLLRTFFGLIYIILPHLLILVFVLIGVKLVWLISVFVILLTGKFPPNLFQFQLDILNWLVRVHAAVYNLTDEYPKFGLGNKSEKAYIEISYPEDSNRLTVLLRFIFLPLWYVPHLIILPFLSLAAVFLFIVAFFAVVITGKYPERIFSFQVDYLKWVLNIAVYLLNLTDNYPPILPNFSSNF